MKSKLTVMFLTAVMGLPAPLLADHSGGTAGVARLHNAVHQLDNHVRYSYLSPQVKQSVRRLVQEASMYYNCVNRSPSPFGEHEPGRSCEYNEQRMLQVWYSVDRFLYDTYYDFPQVYRAYEQARYEIEQIR
jgi:hypothetical protein